MSKINLNQGCDIVLFSYAGKTMIGKLYNPVKNTVPGSIIAEGSVILTMLATNSSNEVEYDKLYDNYYIVDNPCQVQFDVVKQNTGSAKLNWKLVPFFYKKLLRGGAVSSPFAFPKETVCLSNLCEDTMDNNLIQAYKELVQMTI